MQHVIAIFAVTWMVGVTAAPGNTAAKNLTRTFKAIAQAPLLDPINDVPETEYFDVNINPHGKVDELGGTSIDNDENSEADWNRPYVPSASANGSIIPGLAAVQK